MLDQREVTSCTSSSQNRFWSFIIPLIFLYVSTNDSFTSIQSHFLIHSLSRQLLTMKQQPVIVISSLLVHVFVPSIVSWQLPEIHTLIDLTHTLNNNTLHWLTVRPFEMRITHNGTKVKGKQSVWYQSEEINLATHTGTHLDAPCHFAAKRWCVSDIPIEHLTDRPAVVVDVTKDCIINRDYEVTLDDFIKWESFHGYIPEGAVILIKTGWARYWPIKEQYFGTESNDPTTAHFPGIHTTAARWLTQNRKVVGVGIEGPSVDGGQSSSQTHVILFEKNIYAIENLPNLYQMPARGARITILPLKLEQASGSPVRIIANLQPSRGIGSSSCCKSIPFLIFMISLLFTTSTHVLNPFHLPS